MCLIANKKYVEIAELLEISKQTVNSWVSGRRKIPQKHLESLSKIFNGMPLEYFQANFEELSYEERTGIQVIIINQILEKVRTMDEATQEYKRLEKEAIDKNDKGLLLQAMFLLNINDLFELKDKFNEVLKFAIKEDKQEDVIEVIMSLFYIIIEKKININILGEILDVIYWNKELKQDKMNVPDNWEKVDFETELINLIKCIYKQNEENT
ncbi:helix-turn-helix domain-containing protein [Clostridium sp. MB40-C1]|uniref:helix-turn-helix domain-containing protein n=1 Tax=Clostridium sp. MB40-C1 TaxID=3070996 RepID=UPI0027E1C85A|nr:helix-turn-helix domain-containing protein [Clostridium sp. MB40-C1]WMJ81227.1 helix-turn-helix domain-containing protein [Clostridium sp. MB40-C1]